MFNSFKLALILFCPVFVLSVALSGSERHLPTLSSQATNPCQNGSETYSRNHESTPGRVSPLRVLAERQHLFMGTAVASTPLKTDSSYQQVLAREFSQLTPENAMKFAALRPSLHQYNFDAADKMVAFAQRHQMRVYGHTLVWHRSLPNWLKKGNWSRSELRTILKEHITTVVGRYRGRIALWEVVNEAIDDKIRELRASFWHQGLGEEYIAQSFHWAHAADPAAKLIYNDYGAEALNHKFDAIYALVRGLKQQGVPIHGVGLQMHKSLRKRPDPAQVTMIMERFNALGLEVYITEMDVGGVSKTSAKSLAAQADIYRDMLTVYLNAVNCKAFSVWGVADQWSWIPTFYKRPDAPLLFDTTYQPKSAYKAIARTLKEYCRN